MKRLGLCGSICWVPWLAVEVSLCALGARDPITEREAFGGATFSAVGQCFWLHLGPWHPGRWPPSWRGSSPPAKLVLFFNDLRNQIPWWSETKAPNNPVEQSRTKLLGSTFDSVLGSAQLMVPPRSPWSKSRSGKLILVGRLPGSA